MFCALNDPTGTSILRTCVICEDTCVHWPVCSDRPPALPGKNENVGASASRLPQTLRVGPVPSPGRHTSWGGDERTGYVEGGTLPVSRASEMGHAERDTWCRGCGAGGTWQGVLMVGVSLQTSPVQPPAWPPPSPSSSPASLAFLEVLPPGLSSSSSSLMRCPFGSPLLCRPHPRSLLRQAGKG